MSDCAACYSCITEYTIQNGIVEAKYPEYTFTDWFGGQLSDKIKSRRKIQPIPTEARIITDFLKRRALPHLITYSHAYTALGEHDFVVFDAVRDEHGSVVSSCFFQKIPEDNQNHQVTPKIRYGTHIEILNNIWNKKKGTKFSLPKWVKYGCRFSSEARLLEYRRTVEEVECIRFEVKVKLYRLPPLEYCGALPKPPLPNSNDSGKTKYFVIKSLNEDHFCKEIYNALFKVNNIVRNTNKKVILLKADPGSGKESFAEVFHHGTARPNSERFRVFSVGGMPVEEIRSRLFGVSLQGGQVARGLIADLAGGTLVLDEFDKAANNKETRKAFYSSLLRVFENDEYVPEKSMVADKADVNWVLAGAFSEGTSDLPPDMWSRITDSFEIENPLECFGYGAALFIHFHFLETVRWLDQKGHSWIVKKEEYGNSLTVIARVLLFGEVDPIGDKPALPCREIEKFALRFDSCVARRNCRWWHGSTDGIRAVLQAANAASRCLREGMLGKLGKRPEWPIYKEDEALQEAVKALETARRR